ncbi:MAG: ABC transporter substrate-binding protein, partial [Cyanobacteria bacterium J06649_4]
ETYSQWIKHETPFNSPAVLAAFNEFATFLRTPDYVKGGVEGAIATNYGESSTGLFSNPPDCYMHRQGNFITSFFPENQIPRVDYDVFLLPPIDPRFGTPLLISGEAIVMFNYTPESKALIEYLLTPTPHEIWAGLGGFISPQKDIAPEAYPDLVTQNIAQILADAEVIRFDGSDLMPGYVGSEVFWDGIMTLAEGESAEAVAQTIDNSWP